MPESVPTKMRNAVSLAHWDEMVLLKLSAPERSPGGDVGEKPPVYRLLSLSPSLQDEPEVIVGR